jgi:hypothetical protein
VGCLAWAIMDNLEWTDGELFPRSDAVC